MRHVKFALGIGCVPVGLNSLTVAISLAATKLLQVSLASILLGGLASAISPFFAPVTVTLISMQLVAEKVSPPLPIMPVVEICLLIGVPLPMTMPTVKLFMLVQVFGLAVLLKKCSPSAVCA